MKNRVFVPVLATVLLMAACVTINIYFPASAAEKAADKIIDEVWQEQGAGNAASSAPATPVQTPEKP